MSRAAESVVGGREEVRVRGGEAAFVSDKARNKALILLRKISESMRRRRIDCGFAAPTRTSSL